MRVSEGKSSRGVCAGFEMLVGKIGRKQYTLIYVVTVCFGSCLTSVLFRLVFWRAGLKRLPSTPPRIVGFSCSISVVMGVLRVGS